MRVTARADNLNANALRACFKPKFPIRRAFSAAWVSAVHLPSFFSLFVACSNGSRLRSRTKTASQLPSLPSQTLMGNLGSNRFFSCARPEPVLLRAAVIEGVFMFFVVMAELSLSGSAQNCSPTASTFSPVGG